MNAIATLPPANGAAIDEMLLDACDRARETLGGQQSIRFEAVDAHSNFNHLFRCVHGDASYFLKVSLEAPKALTDALPKQRILSEARAMSTFALHGDGVIDVPEVIAVRDDVCMLLMSDVGAGRRNLADVVRDDYALYARSVGRMARGVGRFHSRSRDAAETEESPHIGPLREFAYRALIRPGVFALAGDRAELPVRQMQGARMCMIHSDLWAKNMLIGKDGRMALLDFEGAMLGDPAYDLATLLAVATMPVFQYDVDPALWRIAWQGIVEGYADGVDDPEWLGETYARLPQTLAVWLAARVAGPFPYAMPAEAREAISRLTLSLLIEPTAAPSSLADAVARGFATRDRH